MWTKFNQIQRDDFEIHLWDSNNPFRPLDTPEADPVFHVYLRENTNLRVLHTRDGITFVMPSMSGRVPYKVNPTIAARILEAINEMMTHLDRECLRG